MNIDAQHPIIAVGDLVWDVLAKPDTILLPGGDTTGRIALAPGGSAANVAAWIAPVSLMTAWLALIPLAALAWPALGSYSASQVTADEEPSSGVV